MATTVGLTPVERHGAVWVKRDDLYERNGARGGKARMAYAVVRALAGDGPVRGLVSCGPRQSGQAVVVAQVAAGFGVPCRFHAPTGALGPDLDAAVEAGAEVIQHRPGYLSVVRARARLDAAERGWVFLPPGLEHEAAVAATAVEVANLPAAGRLVVPVGSGMNLAGILAGVRLGPVREVLGVVLGADPTRRLTQFALGWSEICRLIPAPWEYAKPAPVTTLGDLDLHPHYEAKCLPFLSGGDVLWCVAGPARRAH